MDNELKKIISEIDLIPDTQVLSKSDRIGQTPKADGEWKNLFGSDGRRGMSNFYPTDKERIELLEQYGTNHVKYSIYGEPDFSPFAQAQVKISNMEGGTAQSRTHNFANANRKMLGTEWAEKRGLKTQTDIQRYMAENKLTWHEKSDGVTMQMLPSEINGKFGHVGGVSTIAHMETEEEGLRRFGHAIGVAKVTVAQKGVQTAETLNNVVNEADVFIDNAISKFISDENFARINRAGVNAAMDAAVFAATLSIVKNTTSVIRGDISKDKVVKEVLVDTSTSAVTAYATGTLMEKLSIGHNEASLLIVGTVQMSKQLINYVNGDINEQQFIKGIAENAVYLSAGYIGKCIGANIGNALLPGVGGVIGQYIGEMVTTAVCSEVISIIESSKEFSEAIGAIKFYKEFDKQNSKMISAYRNAEHEIKMAQARMEFIIQKENNKLLYTIRDGFEEIIEGIKNENYNQVKGGMMTIGNKFGLTQDDFSRDLVTQNNIFLNTDEILSIE